MGTIDRHFFDIGYMDTLSSQQTSVHQLDPRAKLLTTLVFVVVVVSFGKYEISALVPFFIFPVALCALGNVPPAYLIKKLVLVSPFAILLGIFNPLLDRDILIHLAGIEISGGWVSFASILVRFVLTVGVALTLIAVTGFNAVCMALEKLGAPKIFVVQLLFLHRYMFVLVDEAARIFRARALRSFGGEGTGIKSYGSLVGQLLLRTLDRAQRIYLAMSCRGFEGRIHVMRPLRFGSREIGFVFGWSAIFILMRFYNIPVLIGRVMTELMQ
jgi:cobalt/nickel transport system permease protein